MIQDIAPLHLYNEWHNVQPEKDDWVICMQERKILERLFEDRYILEALLN